MQKFIIEITEENEALIQDDNLECYLLTSSLTPDFTARFAAKAREAGKIVLAGGEDAPDFCRDYGLDGLLLDLSRCEKIKPAFEQARQTVGKGAFIGVISRSRRHEAMIISECEPDFLGFRVWRDGIEKTKELLSWYSELFLIQSAAVVCEDGVAVDNLAADIVVINDKFYKDFSC